MKRKHQRKGLKSSRRLKYIAKTTTKPLATFKTVLKNIKKSNSSRNSNTSRNNNNSTKKNTMCAPFINPTDLSNNTTQGLTQSNLNIIKSATSESCFPIESLHKIADKWNETNKTNMIVYNDSTSGEELWKSINRVMSSQCNNEICWIKQEFLKNTPLSRELMKNFKPIMPKKWKENKYEWLNTIDIRDVMNQYEIKYRDFEFIGPVPIDFDTVLGFGQCVINELCKIDLEQQIKNNKNKIGIIFNLDKHTQSGSHWVAAFVNITDQEICYWDSYGSKPVKEIVTLMDKLKKQGEKLGKNMNIKINNVRHQYKNSECGVYCIYFITSLLSGKKFEDIIKNIIDDDTMNGNRIKFFNKIEE
jgi:hypothetical protein